MNLGPPIPVYDAYGPWPNVGILSTPVIDSTTNTMYVVAHVSNASAWYQLHALDITTGADKGDLILLLLPLIRAISWVTVAISEWDGAESNYKLDLFAIGSCPNGWVIAYDKSSLAQKAVFESTNGAQGGGFRASGGAPAIDDTTGNVYLMSGTDYDDQWISPPPATCKLAITIRSCI